MLTERGGGGGPYEREGRREWKREYKGGRDGEQKREREGIRLQHARILHFIAA